MRERLAELSTGILEAKARVLEAEQQAERDRKKLAALEDPTNDPLAQALLTELEKVSRRRIHKSVSWETVRGLIKDALNPQPLEENVISASPLPVIPPEFPKLLVNFGKTGLAEEWIIISSFAEWAPLHHWYTVFPSQQPASRPITTTLEAEIEKLKAAGAKERVKEDWKRRKELATK